MTVYDLPGRLHPEFEPVVLDDVPLSVSGKVAYRVVLTSPYWRETLCTMALFVADNAGDSRWTGRVWSRSYGEWWARPARMPPLEVFKQEMARVVEELGERVLNECRPLAAEWRREVYGPRAEGMNHE